LFGSLENSAAAGPHAVKLNQAALVDKFSNAIRLLLLAVTHFAAHNSLQNSYIEQIQKRKYKPSVGNFVGKFIHLALYSKLYLALLYNTGKQIHLLMLDCHITGVNISFYANL